MRILADIKSKTKKSSASLKDYIGNIPMLQNSSSFRRLSEGKVGDYFFNAIMKAKADNDKAIERKEQIRTAKKEPIMPRLEAAYGKTLNNPKFKNVIGDIALRTFAPTAPFAGKGRGEKAVDTTKEMGKEALRTLPKNIASLVIGTDKLGMDEFTPEGKFQKVLYGKESIKPSQKSWTAEKLKKYGVGEQKATDIQRGVTIAEIIADATGVGQLLNLGKKGARSVAKKATESLPELLSEKNLVLSPGFLDIFGPKIGKDGSVQMENIKDFVKEFKPLRGKQSVGKLLDQLADFQGVDRITGGVRTNVINKIIETNSGRKIEEALAPIFKKKPNIDINVMGKKTGEIPQKPASSEPMVNSYGESVPLDKWQKKGSVSFNEPIEPAKPQIAQELGLDVPASQPTPSANPVDTLVDNIENLPEMTKKEPGALRKAWDKFAGPGSYLRDVSEEGRQLMREILSTRAEMDMAQADVAGVFKKWLDTYRPDKNPNWYKEIESGAGTEMANQFKKITDYIHNDALKAGFNPKYLEKYVTRIHDWSKEDQMIKDIARNRGIPISEAREVLSKTRKAMDALEEAISTPAKNMADYITRYKNASLEFSRAPEIPPELEKYRITDVRAVMTHLLDTVGDIARAKKLGVSNERIVDLVQNLPDKKSMEYAMEMIKNLGHVQEKMGGADRAASMAKRLVSLMKLQGASSLQNLTQSTFTAGYAGVPETLKNIFTSIPELFKGGVDTGLEKGLVEAAKVVPKKGAAKIVDYLFKGGGFPTTENFNKIVSAKSAKSAVVAQFTRAQKALESGNAKEFNRIRRELEDVFLVDVKKAIKEGKLSPDEIKKAGWGLAHRTQFLHPEFETPSAIVGKGVKGLLGQFKVYAWNQPKIVYKSLQEAANVNPRKLINNLVMAYTLGYPLSKVSDAIFKKEDSKNPAAVLMYGMGGTGMGILQSIWTSSKYGNATSALAGPAIGEIGALADNVAKAANGNSKPLEKQLISDIPIIGRYLKSNLYPPADSSSSSSSKSKTRTTAPTNKSSGSSKGKRLLK